MKYETVIAIENFIKNLNNPKKQRIARDLVVNSSFEIREVSAFDSTDLYIQDLKSGNIYKLSNYINSICNC